MLSAGKLHAMFQVDEFGSTRSSAKGAASDCCYPSEVEQEVHRADIEIVCASRCPPTPLGDQWLGGFVAELLGG